MKSPVLVVVVLAVSTAAGSSWAFGGGAGPTTPVSRTPTAVAFWDEGRGLIGTGLRGSRGAILLTTDGGRTTRLLVHLPGSVTWVGVASRRQAWAVIAVCKGDQCSRHLWHSSDGGVRWSVIGRASFEAASFADAKRGFAAYGLRSGLITTADGGRTWQPIHTPCGESAKGVSFVSRQRGWLLCVSQPGVGNQGKAIYRTDDAGAHWRRLVSVDFRPSPNSGGLGLYGYPQGIAFATDGVGVLWESRGTLYLTRDGGRHWQAFPAIARPEWDFGFSGAAVPGRAFVLLARTPVRPIPFRLLATTDDLTGWRSVRTWASAVP